MLKSIKSQISHIQNVILVALQKSYQWEWHDIGQISNTSSGKRTYVRSYDLFNEYGVANCKIQLIEYFPCATLQELRKREGKHINNNEYVNKCVAGRTCKEFYQDNKEHIIEWQKEYNQNNKDKIKEYKQ